MKPLCIDLYCGLGGWAEGFLAEGYDVIGFDIERHDYGTGGYPGQFVLQDVLTLHGSQFRRAAVIVASPPCQAYSYRAMPWKRAKALPPPSNELFDACFRIADEAGVPIVVENVKGAQPWVGRAKWHYGSYFLWGDVPALMPMTLHRKVAGFNFHQHEKTGAAGGSFQTAAVKSTGQDWNRYKQTGEVSPHWRMVAGVKCAGQQHGSEYAMTRGPGGMEALGIKNASTVGGSWFNVAHGKAIPGNQAGAPQRGDGLKQAGLSGPLWFDHGAAAHSSKFVSRKAASALIAKIPLELASHIARCFYPKLARKKVS